MVKRLFSLVLIFIIFLSCLPSQVSASTYVNGFNDGKKAGYDLGHEAGYNAGYKDRDREAQSEIVIIILKTIAVVVSISVLVFVPATIGITAYFVNRKRDKTGP